LRGPGVGSLRDRLLAAVAEAIEIGEKSGCPVQLSHHKAGGANAYGLTKQSLPLIAEARARGVDVTIDVYPYVASSSGLAAMLRAGGEIAFTSSPAIIASVKYNHEKYEAATSATSLRSWICRSVTPYARSCTMRRTRRA
jgi:hypothetical protein